MEKKIALYLCAGCELGQSLNLDALAKLAKGEHKVQLIRQHPFLCSDEGLAIIKKDIAEGANALVVAGCSSRIKEDAFSFGPQILVERVNLREQCIWCHPPNDEDTQMLAEDQLRMALVKITKTELPQPYQAENLNRDILVVGGGLAGMNAALQAAKAGYHVTLVEKEPTLGGWVANQPRVFRESDPYLQPGPAVVEELIAQLTSCPNLTIHTAAFIKDIKGAPGLFDVTVDRAGEELAFPVGAVVQANGARAYEESKLTHLAIALPDVVTSETFSQMIRNNRILRPSDNKAPQKVVFLLCAGSRDPDHLPYCSSTCCTQALTQALDLRDQLPHSMAFVVYRDMRTPGQGEHFYRQAQENVGIFLTKGQVEAVTDAGKKVMVECRDTLLGERLQIEADLVVLATGMVPRTGEGERTLGLAYRQGPEMPTLEYGFPDSHFICFPYETRRTGIYSAGAVRAPLSVDQALEDGFGAALKAIQCVEMTSRGEAVHPRAGDQSYPEFFMQRCTQCKRCTEECPFGAINEDAKGNPLPNPTRCRRCGVCMGACPERIISFKNYSVDMIGSMIKAIEVPEEDEEKPRILLFLCENDAYPAMDALGKRRIQYPPWVRIIPLRCLGSLNLVWIADALSKGIDGILLLGCPFGDDYQCHFVHGSELASTRLSKVSETLNRLALESDRIRMEQISICDVDRIPGIINEFVETLEAVGPNPYKEM